MEIAEAITDLESMTDSTELSISKLNDDSEDDIFYLEALLDCYKLIDKIEDS